MKKHYQRLNLAFLILLITHFEISAQRQQTLESNRYVSVHGSLGISDLILGVSLPLGKSGWDAQVFRISNIITARQSTYPIVYFFGGSKRVPINSKLSLNVGAGITSTLDFKDLSFSISPLTQINYRLLPWLSMGGSYSQTIAQGDGLEESRKALLLLSTFIDIKWHKKSKGLITRRSKNPIHLNAFASTGLILTSAGVELSKSRKSNLAIRAQIFTKYGGLFKRNQSFNDIQWLGMVCKYHLDEITLKAGGGLTTNVFSSGLRSTFSPYFLASVQQKLIPKTYLVLELWQPTFNYFSPSRAPFFQVGLSIELN